MPLNKDVPARDNGEQNIQFLRKRFTFDGSGGSAGITAGVVVGRLKAGAIILGPISGIDTNTVFNAATNNRFQIGIAGAVSKYGLNVTAAALGFAPMAVAVGHRLAADTDILVTPDVTGGSQTTGDAEAIIAFINPN